MEKFRMRYTDQDLIELLQIWCTDYNKLPTQRDILADDRMPTHHTYLGRFDSMKEAMKLAGISNVEDTSALHNILKSALIDNNNKVEEFIGIHNIMVDFVVTGLSGETFIIDIVNVSRFTNSEDKIRVMKYREMCIELQADLINAEYVQITNLLDIQRLSKLLIKGIKEN